VGAGRASAVRPVTDFAERAERHRGELRVHCYRMLGSFDEAEELVQEVFLRAWRGRDGFEGRSSLRAWLYRIATNACLDFLDGRSRRTPPDQADSPAGPWLQPFPDHLWEPVAARADHQPRQRRSDRLARGPRPGRRVLAHIVCTGHPFRRIGLKRSRRPCARTIAVLAPAVLAICPWCVTRQPGPAA
jgi:RNA polymerase sigma factor (sigma-70 family)